MSQETSGTILSTVSQPSRGRPYIRWLLIVLVTFIIVLNLQPLFRPDGVVYEVAGGQITARSVGASKTIPAGTPVIREPVNLQRRLLGTDRPGYVVGRFAAVKWGEVEVFSDGSQPALVFRTSPLPTVITPEEPARLLDAWRQGQTATFKPTRPSVASLGDLLGLIILVPLLIFLVRNPKITYKLTENELVVKTAFSTLRFPKGATKAELTHEPLGARLGGIAIPSYYTGVFSTRNLAGGRVHALATSSSPEQAVVLKLDGKAYYLTPAEPQQLVSAFQNF